jgi:hypothetical protein
MKYLRAALNKHAKNSPGRPTVVLKVSMTNSGKSFEKICRNKFKRNFVKKIVDAHISYLFARFDFIVEDRVTALVFCKND